MLTIEEFRRTLVAAGVKINELHPEDNKFRDYGNNALHLLGTISVRLEINIWVVEAKIQVIGGNRPSAVGRVLMSSFGLQLIQNTTGKNVMSIQEE